MPISAAVLVRLSRLAILDRHAAILDPLHEGFGQELRALVGAQHPGRTVFAERISARVDRPHWPNRIMTRLHEARFYQSCPDGSALCTLCPHDCHVPDGARGACGVRYNQGGKLYTLVYDRVVARELNPIEKKPFFHFLPGSHAYSISTVGCNLRCAFCQNWHISQWPKDHLAKHVQAGGHAERGSDPVCPQLAELQGEIPHNR